MGIDNEITKIAVMSTDEVNLYLCQGFEVKSQLGDFPRSNAGSAKQGSEWYPVASDALAFSSTLSSTSSTMEYDWENDDDEDYPYVEEDQEIDLEDELIPDDPDITVEQPEVENTTEGDDGLHAQRPSILEIIDCKPSCYHCSKTMTYTLAVPVGQTVQAGPAGGPTADITSSLTMDQIRMLLNAAQPRGSHAAANAPAADDEDDDPDYVPDEDDDEDAGMSYYIPWGGQRPKTRNWFKPVTEAQAAGVGLINSGEFGRLRANRKVNVRRMIKKRELGINRCGGKMEKEEFARVSEPSCLSAGFQYVILILTKIEYDAQYQRNYCSILWQ